MLVKDKKKLARLIKKKRKLLFLRNVWWKFIKFRNDPKWRKPKGHDNPMRLKLKGHPPVVTVGYRTPSEIRYLHPKGVKPVVVYNASELAKYNPKEVIVYVGGNVGLRKRLEIINKARELGFVIANSLV